MVCALKSTFNCGADEEDDDRGELKMVSNGVSIMIQAECEGFDKEIYEQGWFWVVVALVPIMCIVYIIVYIKKKGEHERAVAGATKPKKVDADSSQLNLVN